MSEKAGLDKEIEDFVALHDGELNELLQEYWVVRKSAGECHVVLCHERAPALGIAYLHC
jgi:hypothetical protein